jgi:hypothetical protein
VPRRPWESQTDPGSHGLLSSTVPLCAAGWVGARTSLGLLWQELRVLDSGWAGLGLVVAGSWAARVGPANWWVPRQLHVVA